METRKIQKIEENELETVAAFWEAARGKINRRIVVCGGTGCIANGSMKVQEALRQTALAQNLKVSVELDVHDCTPKDLLVTKSGCQGFCQVGPLLSIEPDGILYTHVKEADVPEIIERTVKKGEVIDRLLYKDPVSGAHKKGKGKLPSTPSRTAGFFPRAESSIPKTSTNTSPVTATRQPARRSST